MRKSDPEFCQTIYNAATNEKQAYDNLIAGLQQANGSAKGMFANSRIKGAYNLDRTRKF
jgi:hypothetical protein